MRPESPGDLFDGTEIDEILTLRITDLTDEEKAGDGRGGRARRALLDRTESLAADQLLRLHGTMRSLRPVRQEEAMNRPGTRRSDRKRRACLGSATWKSGPGDRVRLWPRGRADILDMALEGKTATVEAIEQDFEDRVYLAVTVDDDPGKDLGHLAGSPATGFSSGPRRSNPSTLIRRESLFNGGSR